VLLALTAACGHAPTLQRPASGATPSASATPTEPTASPGQSQSPSPTATAGPVAAVGFSCRLPIVINTQSPQAGFISFPDGTFAADAAGAIKSKSFGLAYDRGYNRWLPVDWRFVSDDGTHYAYATYSDTVPTAGAYSVIHIVNVSTGADRAVSRNGQYVIDDYVGTGIYLSAWVGGHDGPGPQIGWILDPSTGGVRALAGGQKYGYWVGAGAGWRTDYNPADPTVHQGMTGPNRLTRVDLASGAEEIWFYQQGADWVQVLGFDRNGHPIVSAGTGQVVAIWLLTDPTHRSRLFSGSVFMSWATADSHGIWLSDGSATYLYTASSGLLRVASVGGQIAGGCH
jgi:hypothetical protein